MPEPVVVTCERAIDADADTVWAVIADPTAHERLDRRVRLESVEGASGVVGSSYIVSMRVGLFSRFATEYTVVEAEPGSRLRTVVSHHDRRVAEQSGELGRRGSGVILVWTVTQWPGRLLRNAAARKTERELPGWLEAVEREALRR